MVALGEGYHNYHHTFPWDYRTSEVGAKINITTFLLNLFQRVGWIWDLKTTSPELIQKMIDNYGDGVHPQWGHEVAPEKADRLLEISKIKTT